VKQEIDKTMEQVARPSVALSRWRDAGALRVLVPLLDAAPAERFAALDHLPLPRGKRAAERKLLRLAMLFFGERRAAADAALKALKFSNHDAAWICRLADARADVGDALDAAMARGDVTDAELRRLAARVGRTAAAGFWRLQAALWAARRAAGNAEHAPPSGADVASAHRRLVRIAYRDAIETGDLQVDGDDLARAGIPKGPALGATLRALLEAVIETPALNTRDQLLELAQLQRDGAKRDS
jgi:tRNA nucleotidyltransferase/poly(A) polymerase